MAKPVVMPKLAMAMRQGKVVEWMVAEGGRVEKGRIIMVIETEKVTYEIEAADSGLLHIAAELNTAVPVNEVVAWLAESEEELARLQAESPGVAAASGAAPAAETAPAPAPAAGAGRGKVKISPAARKMAADLGVDYTTITGTGPGGRIVKEDVQKAAEAAAAAPSPAAAPAEAWDGEVIDGKRVKQSFPLTGIRAAIAEHMIRSLATSAQLTSTADIDMSELIRIRESYLEKEERIGVRISFTDLMVFILARVLKEQPMMNSSLIDNQVILWDSINIGVAVAIELNEVETGLVVPVVRDADKKSLVRISREIKALSKRARSLQFEPDDLGGGTFTLTNFGMFGQGYSISTPVINQPEAAILGAGAITDRAVVVNKEIVVRPIMPLSLTFDHRQLDGAPVGRFMFRLNELMENPHLMFL